MDTAQEFIAWVLDPRRTLEEAFFAEVVVDAGFEQWEHKQNIFRGWDWDARRERGRARRLNPAYRPQFQRERVEKAAEMLPVFTRLSYTSYDSDRPIRDISGLRFLSALTSLDLGHSEIADLSPLTTLPNLADLHLTDEIAEDLRPIARCPKLKQIHLYLYQPWPRLEGWEDFPQLESLWFTGNLLALESLPAFPGVHTARLGAGCHASLPLRDLRRLPAMPRLRSLDLDGVHRLDGIERYPELRSLAVGDTFRDLNPLRALPEVTHLTIKGNLTRDLSPLVRMPALRKLTVQSHHPQDYLVLSDAPRLHEVIAQFCAINRRELATLHALLPSWGEEFGLPAARPLPPLRFRVLPHEEHNKTGHEPHSVHPQSWDDNPGMLASEGDWVDRCLDRRIAKALNHRNWGCTRHNWVNVHSLEAAERLPQIVQVIREFLITTRRPQKVSLRVDLKAEWHRDDEKDPELKSALHRQRAIQDEIDQHLEWERKREEETGYLERLHELRQLEQEGSEVKPEQFAPPPPEPEEKEEDEEEGEDIDAGDVLERAEKSEDEDWDGDEPHPLAERLDCWLFVSESELTASAEERAAAVYLMGREPDEG